MLRKFLTAFALSGLLTSSVLAADAPNAMGTWLTEKSDTGASLEVQIGNCGDKICGKITKLHNSEKKELIGTNMIKNMLANGKGYYYGGQIFAPDTKKWYKSKMVMLTNGNLKVSGCVFSILCRSQIWTPVAK